MKIARYPTDIAEGVETEVQQALLKSAGCDYAQGYLYSSPVPPEAMEALLAAQLTGGRSMECSALS